MANVVIGGRINSTLFGLAKELVQRVKGSTLAELILGVRTLGLADGIVDRPVGRALLGLRWTMVSTRVGAWILVIDGLTGYLMMIGIVSASCGSKRLQVSDNCG